MNQETQGLQKRYFEAIVQGNADACSKVVSDALEKGLNLAHMYCDVITPAQKKMGELWHEGEISVAQEHLATMITLQEMARLRSVFEPKKLHGLQAVVAVAEKDLHVLGAQMVADLLYINGWKVDFLGANVPSRDLVDFVRQKEPHVVAISVSLPDCLPLVKKAILQMKKFAAHPRIIVGGRAIDASFKEELGVEVVKCAQQVVEMLNQNVQPISLNEYLKKIGKQIQFLRKKNKQSQQELANTCGLDRTYISAVEHGKQNITIGALHKISGALEIPINEFLNKVHNTLQRIILILTQHFIFLHMFRSGGTTVNNILLNHMAGTMLGYHRPRKEMPIELRALPIIGTIRNPWDWYVSVYHHAVNFGYPKGANSFLGLIFRIRNPFWIV